jgi:hypothetical protein
MKTSSQFCFHFFISLSLHSQPFCNIPFFQVRPDLMYQCKSIHHVLIFVRAQLVLSLSLPSRCPFGVKMCKLGHQSHPSRLKDSDFSSVHPINCYLNLNKQQSLVFEEQF